MVNDITCVLCAHAQFLDLLFSSHNTLLDESCARIYMDMDQPLSRYWISSSHNTYVTLA